MLQKRAYCLLHTRLLPLSLRSALMTAILCITMPAHTRYNPPVQIDASEASTNIPDAATCSSSGGTESEFLATASAAKPAAGSAIFSSPVGNAEFRSPAEAARVAKLGCGSSGCRQNSSGRASHRISLEKADSLGGLMWMPLSNEPCNSLGAPSISGSSAAGWAAMPSSGSLELNSLQTGSLSSTTASSSGLAGSSAAGGGIRASGDSPRTSSAATISVGSLPWAAAREALQASLQQLVKLPYKEFLRRQSWAPAARRKMSVTPISATSAARRRLGCEHSLATQCCGAIFLAAADADSADG